MNPAVRKTMPAALIAIDWGTTSARAYRLDARGRILDEQSAPLGVQKVEPGKFAQALTAVLGGEIPQDVPMIASGMIGSRQGWIEAPYRDCPADFDDIAAALTPVPGTRLRIVPGLVCRDADGVPDVMRGEEVQVFGAMQLLDVRELTAVLPGTHSKWVHAHHGRIAVGSTPTGGARFMLTFPVSQSAILLGTVPDHTQ